MALNLHKEPGMKKYIYSQKYLLISILILSIITSILSILIVGSIQNIIDNMISFNYSNVTRYVSYLVSILIINFILSYFLVIYNSKLKKKIHLKIKGDLMNSLFNMNHKTYKNTLTSQKINLFETDLNILDNQYFDNILNLFKNSLIIVFGIIYLIKINGIMTVVMIFTSLLVLLLPIILGKNIDYISSLYSSNKDEFLIKIKDIFETMDLIHSYGIEEKILFQFNRILEELERSLYLFNRNLGFYSQIISLGNYIIITISFALGGYFVIRGKISVGELIAITQIVNIIMGPIGESTNAILEIKGSIKIKEKLEKILKNQNQNESLIEDNNFQSIEAKNLCMEIEDTQFALKNINFKIEKNKKYLIIGESGSGKSTLLKLLANILEKTSGQLFLNGNDYSIHKNISKIISYVSQDTFVFNDTLINNITLYKKYSEEEINKALEFSMLENLNNRLANKELNISEMFSGGERKKLALARAILADTDVILLDEINSSLDPISSEIIEDRIFELNNKTIIMIAHKINKENLEKADEIICMNNGRIIEKGTLEELINSKGYFYKNFGELYGKNIGSQRFKKVI